MRATAIFAAAITGSLLLSGTALADEDHALPAHESHQMEEMATDHESHQMNDMTPGEHSSMADGSSAHEGAEHSQNAQGPTPTGEASGGGHHAAAVDETPPNIPVLAAFGAINAAFLLYGFWNKRLSNKKGALI